MGGLGALNLAFQHPDVFGVVAGPLGGRRFRIDGHTRLPDSLRPAAGALHPLFERTHEGQILVNPHAIFGADLPAQALRVAENPVE